MATFVPHAELAKLLGSQIIETTAPSVRALMQEIKVQLAAETWSRLKQAAILVNGVSIHRLRGLDTPLAAGDKVWMVLPSGGG